MVVQPLPPLARSAAELDAADELASFRAQFALPARVYLCGHSLGPQPRCARQAVERHLDKWAAQGVAGHFTGDDQWVTIEDEASKLGLDIVGAKQGEVVYMNSLTVNLHLLMTAFYRPDKKSGRVKILLEEHAFPSDEYAVQTHVESRGISAKDAIVRIAPRENEELLRPDDITAMIENMANEGSLALVLLPGVQYYTGQFLPIEHISKVCREHDVPLGLDLAHAVGNVPLQLHSWGVDFAVWCTYKYLNSGPGSLGGAFMHEKHANRKDLYRLGGWWGQQRSNRFEMSSTFEPQQGIYGFQLSNPSVFGIVPVTASLGLFQQAGGMKALRNKSIALTGFLEEQLVNKLSHSVQIVSPRNPTQRGCQLSIKLIHRYHNARHVKDELQSRGIVCDIRVPDLLRIAPAPLYTSFQDVDDFVNGLCKVLEDASAQVANVGTKATDSGHASG